MMKMDPGYGFCTAGYYDGWDASIANEADCLATCLSEDECTFAALVDGRTCSRYNVVECVLVSGWALVSEQAHRDAWGRGGQGGP